MLSPLELKQAQLQNLEIRVSPEWDLKSLPSDTGGYEPKLEVDVRKRRGHWDFRVTLDVSLTPRTGENCRFELVRVGLVGLFHLPDDVDEALVDKIVPLNCFAILYGIGRGVVAQATGLMPGGPIILPPINFVEALNQRKKRKPQAAPVNKRPRNNRAM